MASQSISKALKRKISLVNALLIEIAPVFGLWPRMLVQRTNW